MKRATVLILVACAVAAFCCTGCAKKFTRQRYETIYTGQSAFDVEKTLGDPADGGGHKFSDTWTYINHRPFYKAVIEFKSGRVSKKVWYDEHEMGDHPDSDPKKTRTGVTVRRKVEGTVD